VDIELATHNPEQVFALRGLHCAEADAFGCEVEVRSGGFSARVPFWPERFTLERFLAELRAMDRTLTGEAQLQPLWETEYVRLQLDRAGGVWVSGEVSGGAGNHLQFGFSTNQTVLAPLIRDLQRVLVSRPPAV
jgi:hypothetical protein